MIILFFLICSVSYTGELEDEALKFFNNHNYKESLKLALASDKEDMILLAARIYEIEGEIKSIELYRKYLELTNYKEKEMIFYVGNLASKYFLYETAFKIFSQDETTFKNILASAIMARFISKYQIAKNRYLKILKGNEDNYEIIIGLAISYQMLSDWDNSIGYFKKSLKLKEDKNVYIALSEIYMYLGNIKKAKVLIERALKKFDSEQLRKILIEVYNK